MNQTLGCLGAAVLMFLPAGAAAQPCTTLARYGVPAKVSANDDALYSAATWLRQFRTYEQAQEASGIVGFDLAQILSVAFQPNPEGWTQFRESLDSFAALDKTAQQRYREAFAQMHASVAASTARCMSEPGLKVWIEYHSDIAFALAARFDKLGKTDQLSIDRIIYDQSKIQCVGTLTEQERVGVVRKRNRPVDSTVRTERCTRLTLDETRIVVAAQHDPVGGATLVIPTFEPIGVSTETVPSSARVFVPPHTRGDREFAGNRPQIRVEAWFETDSSSRHLFVRLRMHAGESGGDRTTASGTSPMTNDFRIFSAPAGLVITSFPSERDSLDARTESHEAVGTLAGQGWAKFKLGGAIATKRGIIDSWEVVGDTPGEDAGIGTLVRVNVAPVSIRMRRANTPSSNR